ncbi:MAG: hypothetical protein GF317_19545 [Candidatus Lokiarchaeota archaeon]|nr:hypothetical protein [Candidatus Lokiarchaeota archaeon]MBD3201691.1 hypothetical protein [Candidatus Lokiarchaeota archaeon]
MNIKHANKIIAHVSETLDAQINKRGLLESQLFPVTAYICVSFYNAYDMLYDILKKISEKTTPEKMGKESRKILSELQALTINYIPLYYFEGRMGEIHRKGGDPRAESEEKREESLFVLDFWERLASSYHLDDKLFVSDLNNKNIALDQPDIDWTIQQLQNVEIDEAKKLKRYMTNLEVFSFLDECEARAKLCDHGPYPINDEEILVFREISHLYDGGEPHFPWSKTKTKAPYKNIAFALRLKNVTASFDNFATMETEPKTFNDRITGVALMTRIGDKIKPLELDILEEFNDYAVNAQKELYVKFSQWDRREKLIAGAYAYCYGYARYSNFVGITDEFDWSLTDRTMEKYIPEFMETDFDKGITRHFRTPRKKKKEGPSLYLFPEE